MDNPIKEPMLAEDIVKLIIKNLEEEFEFPTPGVPSSIEVIVEFYNNFYGDGTKEKYEEIVMKIKKLLNEGYFPKVFTKYLLREDESQYSGDL